jgi:hypothetical protein
MNVLVWVMPGVAIVVTLAVAMLRTDDRVAGDREPAAKADLWPYNFTRRRVARIQERRQMAERRKTVHPVSGDRQNAGDRRKRNRRCSDEGV